MDRRHLLASAAGMLGLSACSVALPFRQVNAPEQGSTAVLSVTHVTLKREQAARDVFFAAVKRVDAVMEQQPGLIGHGKRLELFGDEAWTISAWRSDEDVSAFVRSPIHRQAMQDAAGTYIDARVARIMMPAEDVPVSWQQALATLDDNARQYYE